MKINLVLYASLTRFVAGSSAGEVMNLDIPGDSTVHDVMVKVGIPSDLKLILLVNGRSVSKTHKLNDDDRLAAFPTIAGG
jgi:sulfur carrier protein ThiS